MTIVTYSRECLFGEITDGQMHANEMGRIIMECWDELPAHSPNVELDAFILMPNHVHGIIVIADASLEIAHAAGKAHPVRATHGSPLQPQRPRGPQSDLLGAIVGSLKSAATKRINETRRTPGALVWHRNYYEHVIRGEKSLQAIREYIAGNPADWLRDEENPANY